jgi:predicted transcriptional regulator
MKLKKQRPGPKGAVKPTKKKTCCIVISKPVNKAFAETIHSMG